MNAFLSFLKSKDGLVAIGGIIVLGIVSHYGSPYNPWINLLARVGNILLFLYILWRVAGKKLGAFLSGRRASIAEEFDSLEKRKAETEQNLHDLEKRIANLDAERQAILEESKQQAQALRERMLAKAEEDANRIREQATRAAENESQAMRDGIREQIADDIVRAVEEMLKSRLATNADKSGMTAGHAQLIDNALRKVVLQ